MAEKAQDVVRSQFIEKLGVMSQAEGLPRVAGRVFGMLIFDGDPRSFGDIATELGVSRGSISSAARLLEQRRLIRRICFSGSREVFFQIVDKPYAAMLNQVADEMDTAKAEIENTTNKIDPKNEGAIRRIGEFAEFYEKMAGLTRMASKDL